LQLLDRLAVFTQIHLASHEDKGNARAEVAHFRNPFVWYVLKAVRVIDRETDEQDVGVWV
jgi:hypothetical protein